MGDKSLLCIHHPPQIAMANGEIFVENTATTDIQKSEPMKVENTPAEVSSADFPINSGLCSPSVESLPSGQRGKEKHLYAFQCFDFHLILFFRNRALCIQKD
ncbi:unnamed protein product [Trichobilharzia regenti]|nr:unnamed protein product [Trichobilharzia regenti]